MIEKYLKMQKTYYDNHASLWSLDNKDPVVGSYDSHDKWPHWERLLFRDIDTTDMKALEYGCGPGRNLIKFNKLFSQIDGVDISKMCLEKAKINLEAHSIVRPTNLLLGEGNNIPANDDTYDFVYSIICLQHIACYSIRFNIFKEVHRVLKSDGQFSFQMGFKHLKNKRSVGYYEDATHIEVTNGKCDTRVDDEACLKDDLLKKLNFKNYQSTIVEPNANSRHEKWIFVTVQK
jgi:ubiquinone/menaquinone biosynthesis C-methylase UbiE